MSSPIWARDGAEPHPGAAHPVLPEIFAAISHLPSDQPGLRLVGIEALRPVLSASGAVGAIAATYLGVETQPVRALLFDKSESTNWSLGWHQDRTICVRKQRVVEGFGPWSVKRGIQHVAPPFDLLARMVTLRVHLDEVDEDNAPLFIALGSHRQHVPEPEIERIVGSSDIHVCIAAAGDIWAYATPILHASALAKQPRRRRVLQIDYSADPLPGGLEWLGV